MMDDFKFVQCPNCGWEKNPRKPCFNCGDKAKTTRNTSSNNDLTADKARIAYFEQLAADRLAQNIADAERIAELEEALEPFADCHGQFAKDARKQAARLRTAGDEGEGRPGG